MTPHPRLAQLVRRLDLGLLRRRWGAVVLVAPASVVAVGLAALAGPWASIADASAERRGGLGVRASLLVVTVMLIASQAGFWRGKDLRVWSILGLPGASLASLATWYGRRALGLGVLLTSAAVVRWASSAEAATWALWWFTSLAWLPEVAVLSMLWIAGPAGQRGGAPWLDAVRGSAPPESAGVLLANAAPFLLFAALSTGLAGLMRSIGPSASTAVVLGGAVVARLWVSVALRRGSAAAYDVARALSLSDLRDEVLQEAAHPGPAPWEAWVGLGDPTPATRFAWRRLWRARRTSVVVGLLGAVFAPWVVAGWERDLMLVVAPAVLGHAVLAEVGGAPAGWQRWLGRDVRGGPRLWWRVVAVPAVLSAAVGVVAAGWGAVEIGVVFAGPMVQRLGGTGLGPRAAWAGGVVAGLLGTGLSGLGWGAGA